MAWSSPESSAAGRRRALGMAVGAVAVLFAFPASGQTSAQVQGILEESKKPLSGAVLTAIHLFSPTGAGLSAPVVAVSGADGSFVFDGLAAGSYRVCVRLVGSDVLDPCEWSEAPPLVNVDAGQKVTGFEVTVTRGAYVHVQVEDASRKLRDGERSGKPVVLLAGVWDQRGMFHPLQVVADGGRDRVYRLAVPSERTLKFQLRTNKLKLEDERGRSLTGKEPAQEFRVTRGGPDTYFRFKVKDVEN